MKMIPKEIRNEKGGSVLYSVTNEKLFKFARGLAMMSTVSSLESKEKVSWSVGEKVPLEIYSVEFYSFTNTSTSNSSGVPVTPRIVKSAFPR